MSALARSAARRFNMPTPARRTAGRGDAPVARLRTLPAAGPLPAAGCRGVAIAVRLFAGAMAAILSASSPAGQPAADDLGAAFAATARPLVVKYCGECHSDQHAEAELDLTAFHTVADVRGRIEAWEKVAEMLASRQMPPPEAAQPADDERAALTDWVERVLAVEARRLAGDPGPVVLRRLSNAQYTYVLGDLTGLPDLAPAREFPADGASGEGFTNAGGGLVMSPALLDKYLDAARQVASHAVLLPDGIRFSPGITRRDWTEELLGEIRGLYSLYCADDGATQINLQGVVFDTNGGGRLPIERYLLATLEERRRLAAGADGIAAVARQRRLSPKYLAGLWELLSGPVGRPPGGSLVIDHLRAQWQAVEADDPPARAAAVAALTAEVARWQQALWRFSSVGHIGKAGGPKAWMEPVDPLTARHELRVKLSPLEAGGDLVLYLVVSDAGDGHAHDVAIWERPRLVAPGRSDLLVRDVRGAALELAARRERILAGTPRALAAAAEAAAAREPPALGALAQRHGLEPDVLAAWFGYLGVGAVPAASGPPLERTTKSVAGYDFIQGWIGDDALSVVANSSDQHVRIPGNMPPRSVAVHPAPTLAAAIGWRSPLAAQLRIEGTVRHAHPECGDGVSWTLELRKGHTRQRLAAGTAQGASAVGFGPLEGVAVAPGDLVALLVGPREGNHSCDLTTVELELGDGSQTWNLSADVAGDILAGNPHSDRRGQANVWHFFSEPAAGPERPVIPAGSLLARWQQAAEPAQQQALAEALGRLVAGGGGDLPADAPDAELYRQLTSLGGPLLAAALGTLPREPAAADSALPQDGYGLDPARFGPRPLATGIDEASLAVEAPSVVELRLPAGLAAGAELVSAGTLHPEAGREGSVQFQVLSQRPAEVRQAAPSPAVESAAAGPWTSPRGQVVHATPIVALEHSAARRRIEQALAEHRRWFPPALCYAKIVPVDEVITLTLFHREDEPLRQLMLDPEQAARLDRLWDELRYVSQDALALVDAFEQLWQYATQDADPQVFEPLRQPIYDRAASFRQRLLDSEPAHLEAVVRLAEQAYRRPLAAGEADDLGELYRRLRSQELAHDEAVRLLIARVFASPAFLYRAEADDTGSAGGQRPDAAQPEPDPGGEAPAASYRAVEVSGHELAARLSFFLWSSLPDAELREAAASGDLARDEVLAAQARRMLADPRVQRLATEFACQWLQIYEFDAHDEKSEAAFPEFAALRGAMYEEPIRFFADLFARDGSIMEVLDADHTFLNAPLAAHYGIAGVDGPDWRRVEGLKARGRGGILGMAAPLAKQSGASRTSPILRGNWVCEVLLGEKLPKPPAGVPQIPDQLPAGLTERQLIERHSALESCAKCHARIDPLGFALEGFDAVGRARTAADGQPPLDTRARLVDGTQFDGLEGLRSYLLEARREDFVAQFCRKLLGYALGRTVQLSDAPLIDEIEARLAADGCRIGTAVEQIVLSRQFRTKRTTDRQLAPRQAPPDTQAAKGSSP